VFRKSGTFCFQHNFTITSSIFLQPGASELEQGQRLLPNFWGGRAVLPPEVCRCDKTDGDDYLQVEVNSIGLFLLCTKLTKLVDIYDIFAVLV